ncbi:MAG TPA: heparinase II/III family protein, partial [Bryobacteraceae bacterium]|nr:heparinase II/III family protein [Bryobacteraceae bacterium]
MRRDHFLLASAAVLAQAAGRGAPAPKESWLLIDRAEIDAARRKAGRAAWARTALDDLLARAGKALAQPAALPDRGGQWMHWYSCKRDGVGLQTVSPTEHRCPKCGAIYRGDPYDAVVLSHVHNRYSAAVRDLGLAYRFSGNAAYAARAREILVAYADRYHTYPRHDINGQDNVRGARIMPQTLDESTWLIPVAWGYALVRETLAESERRHVDQDLLVAAADVIRAHRMGIHNIQCWKNSAVALAGWVTEHTDLVREAIDDPERGFRAQIARGVTDDGLWFEGSLGYHQYTMQALWPLVEGARQAGLDLYSDRYRSLYDAPLALAFPNGEPPGYNDNRGANVLRYAPLYEIAYARWRRPAYGHLLARTRRDTLEALVYGEQDVPSGPMIPEESVLLRTAGYAMIHTGSVAVAERFGMHGGGHGHPDMLNLVTFGAGYMWGLDPGSINYGVPLHGEWYRSTIAHNTVSVDQQLQAAVDGKLVEWKSGADETRLATSVEGAYPEVTLRRTVVAARSGSVEDRFECSSGVEHVYDWAFHSSGAFQSSLTFEPRGPLGESAGYQHV